MGKCWQTKSLRCQVGGDSTFVDLKFKLDWKSLSENFLAIFIASKMGTKLNNINIKISLEKGGENYFN